MVKHINFRPMLGFSSPHAQTIISYFTRGGTPPHSTPFFVTLDDGDTLCCELSTPPSWDSSKTTVVLLHGLGGSHASSYMVRLSRKLYDTGIRVVRVNLRGCGSGKGLARLPYYAGISHDIFQVLKTLKTTAPSSPIVIIGFSLGANISLKLAAELEDNRTLVHHIIAICPPLDLIHTYKLMSRRRNRIYHLSYLNSMLEQGKHLIGNRRFSSILEFDSAITAPVWGFQNAFDYYQKCSSGTFLPHIQQSCSVLVAVDDPFVDNSPLLDMKVNPSVEIYVCDKGGHMGFFGWAGRQHRYFWLDQLLMEWTSNCTSS